MKAKTNKKSIAIMALVLSLLFVGCSKIVNKPDANSNESSKNSTSTTSEDSNTSKNTTENNNKSKETSTQKAPVSSQEIQDITKKVKDYINGDQGNKPEYQKMHWSKTFLNKADFGTLYKSYLNNGGKKGDVESFAAYITLNAPIQSDWQEMFKKDLYDTYGEKVVRIEKLQGDGDVYQAYIMKDGKEVPYVAVYARTGYFHG
ncbi:hypothetical protein [Clostridium sp. 'White wine YQ']|uniref:hypothetical protein n=1 Tax=Clostridium sp. 'White wine YQ' TaxID=3027474 RepID=UPI0023662C22|nr:hypothetical protein [Clostridium sp. 'White wine YQ']MDD7795374.1 hypothetical protein [Clostridium sp. 'White wine YQ']